MLPVVRKKPRLSQATMKTRFDFCHCAGAIQPDTQWVAVWFGQSRRDQQILKRLEPLRFRRDVYFQKHSIEVAEFLEKVAKSLFPGATLPTLRLLRTDMSATEFLSYLNDAELLPARAPQTVFHTLMQLDPRFYSRHYQLWKKN